MRLFSLVVAGLLWTIPAWAEEPAKEQYNVGDDVPVFTLKVLNNEDTAKTYIGLDAYFGERAKEPKKAVVLSFFATYCEPCKREMPYLAALFDTYKDKGLEILSISIDKEVEKADTLKALAKASNVKFPVLTDRFNIVAKRYFIKKLPCVYVLDGRGKVAMVSVGYDADISKKMLEEIRKALGEPATAPVPENLATLLAAHVAGAETSVDVPKEEGEEEEADVDAGAPARDEHEPGDGAAKHKGKKGKGKGKGKKKGG